MSRVPSFLPSAMWVAAFQAGILLQRSSDHKGWAWAGWTFGAVSVILLSYIQSRLQVRRKGGSGESQ
jgi:hypothetical protein